MEEGASDQSPWEVPQSFWDERHSLGTSGLARRTKGPPVAAPALIVAAIWTLLTVVKAILLVQQGHELGLGMGAMQAWPAEIASLLGLLLAMPISIAAERRSRSAARPARPLLLHLLGWGLFSLVHLAVTLSLRGLTIGLDESYAFSSPWDWLLQLGESTLAYLIALIVFMFARPLPRCEELPPQILKPPVPPMLDAGPSPVVVRLTDGGRQVEVGVQDLVAVSGGGNYVELIFRGGGRRLLRTTLNAAQAALEPTGFRRTHKSWLVLLDAVTNAARTSSGDFQLDLGNGLDAPLSRRNRELLDQVRGRLDASTPDRKHEPTAGRRGHPFV
jgi:hypothetical protein